MTLLFDTLGSDSDRILLFLLGCIVMLHGNVSVSLANDLTRIPVCLHLVIV